MARLSFPKLPKKESYKVALLVFIGTYRLLSLKSVFIPKDIRFKYAWIREYFEKYLHLSLSDMQVFEQENSTLYIFQVKRIIKKKSKERIHLERLARIKYLRIQKRNKEIQRILKYLKEKESVF